MTSPLCVHKKALGVVWFVRLSPGWTIPVKMKYLSSNDSWKDFAMRWKNLHQRETTRPFVTFHTPQCQPRSKEKACNGHLTTFVKRSEFPLHFSTSLVCFLLQSYHAMRLASGVCHAETRLGDAGERTSSNHLSQFGRIHEFSLTQILSGAKLRQLSSEMSEAKCVPHLLRIS